MIDETIKKTFTIEELQDQLYPVHDIMHAWPKSLKDPTEYQHIAPLFDPIAFWKFADPWDVTICVHRETHRCEYLLPEHQCLLLKQHIEDTYGIILPSMPACFNGELWTGKWDLMLKHVSSEPEFGVYCRLAKSATRSLKTAMKLERMAHARTRQLDLAKEKFMAAQTSGGKFVSIDVECYELDHNCTTELGISTMSFDAEGMGGGEIRSRHLLILEYAHLRNEKFVPDMSDAFGHGKSQWVHLRDCKRFVAEAFRAEGGLPVYFIGHDPMADIKYLEKNLHCPFPRAMSVFDTRLMYSAFGGDSVLRNLATCLDGLGVEYWNLHNAGNDAHYTLVGFKEMCTTTPKNPPVVEELPTFSIRDLVAEDLVVKATDEKPVEKKEKSIEEITRAAPADVEPLISFDEFINRSAPHVVSVGTPASLYEIGSTSTQPEDSSPNGVKPPRIKRHYFQQTVEPIPVDDEIPPSTDDITRVRGSRIESPELEAKYIPPQKRISNNHVKSLPVDQASSLLSASSSATITPTRRKNKKAKSQTGPKRGFQSTCAIDMDIMKYGGAIDDLTAAFAGAAFPASKAAGQGTSDARMHKRMSGVGTECLQSIELGMSN